MEKIYSSVYRFAEPGALRPEGWLKKQLEIQAEGLSGHLDQVWPDIRDSAWIGGKAEGWERVPYWLDGFIPLAYLLQKEELIARAKKYVDAILAAQQEDGWICPCQKEERPAYDVWAVFIICKALMVYGQCSGDERAAEAVYRAMKNLEAHLTHHTLFNWGQSRWFEALIPLQWIYEQRPEAWMIELAVTLASQGLSYERLFSCWKDQQPDPQGIWRQQTHIVNLMMALKSEAVFSGLSGQDPDAFARKMYAQLCEAHGTPMGHIQGDECLAGRSPIRGTELCAVVEEMYSCEVLASVTGDPFWLDLLERLAFNSLPATISADMWSHQYDQQLNQVSCSVQQGKAVFGTNGTQANLFGLEPNYGCCTANFSQGWPKLALSAFMLTEKGVLSAALVPATVQLERDGAAAQVTLDTEYPFRDSLRYTVHCRQPVRFELAVRIPTFAESAEADGQAAAPGELWRTERLWQDGDTVEVRLHFAAKLVPGAEGLACVERGPLFFALPLAAKSFPWEYERGGVTRKAPYCDYIILPEQEWGYAFAEKNFRVIENPVGVYPFSREEPPVQLETGMSRIPWGTHPGQPGVCAEKPESLESAGTETVRLQPYGCTTLRMTMMPDVSC